jgi:hypothetical protein
MINCVCHFDLILHVFLSVFQDWVTATDIRVVFNRLLTPDADLASLAQEMQSLANAPSVKFNSQLTEDKEAVVHYVHNESSNALIMDSGPMTLNLGDVDEQDLFKNSFPHQVS